ncbi:MAG: VOC family protein [Hyphomicrobiaceae bacterium]|nr:VOC family protein [Hyphomicrobiaceae bacterium]
MSQPRVSLITLGTDDLARSRGFYEALGFRPSSASRDEVVFFDAGGVVLALFGRGDLGSDAGVPGMATGSGAVALSWNVASEAAVDAALGRAMARGGRLQKAACRAFWGGYSGYFLDPDGHLWEVAFNPAFPLDTDGRMQLPAAVPRSD